MFHGTRPSAVATLALLLGTATISAPTLAQNFPTRPVNLIINMPPGGGSDLVGRIVADKLKDKWNQPVLVINKPSAGGIAGLDEVVKSTPDGHTLGTTTGGLVETPFLTKVVPWKTADFALISLTSSGPFIVAVTSTLPVRTLQELVALLRSNPGKYNYGSVGPGPSRLVADSFQQISKVTLTEIPYKGSAAITQSMLAGETQVMFDAANSIKLHVDSGKFVALAVADTKRLFLMPNIPTTAELGMPEFVATSWKSIVGPGKMPRDLVEKISRDIQEVLARPDVSDFIRNKTGAEARGSSPAEFKQFVDQQIAMLTKAGVKPE